MSPQPRELHVFLNDHRVGSLFDTDPLSFEYAAAWLDGRDSVQVGRIPRGRGTYAGPEVTAFFDNLLPEGELRGYLSKQHQTSTVFGLLLALGGDSVGAFVLLPAGQSLKEGKYVRTTWKQIARDLAKRGVSAVDIHVKDARISLSGAQDKTTLALDAEGNPHLPEGYSPSTHILKPDIQRIRGVFASAANETIVMRAARYAGLEVADTAFETQTKSCLVRRFDRRGSLPDRIERLVQYDLCQLAGVPPAIKYEADGGPGLARCAELIREESAQPAVDLRRLVDWVFFNLYVGNNDGHAKNLSIFILPGHGARLTPFYDLMSTRVYKTLSAKFALAVGGEYVPGNIGRKHVEAMAGDLGIRAAYAFERAEVLAQSVPDACEKAISSIEQDLDESERQVCASLRKLVRSTTKRFGESLLRGAPATRRPAAGRGRHRPS